MHGNFYPLPKVIKDVELFSSMEFRNVKSKSEQTPIVVVTCLIRVLHFSQNVVNKISITALNTTSHTAGNALPASCMYRL